MFAFCCWMFTGCLGDLFMKCVCVVVFVCVVFVCVVLYCVFFGLLCCLLFVCVVLVFYSLGVCCVRVVFGCLF